MTARKLAGAPLRAARLVEHGALAVLGVQVARSLHGRWRRLSSGDRDRLRPLADDVKERALEIRGEADPTAAGRDLAAAGERLATAMIETAAADPELGEREVRALRDELARELERLASADIRASRGPGADGPGAGGDGRGGGEGRTPTDGVA